MGIVVKEWFRWSQAFLGMLLVQVFVTGMQLLSKVILVKGTFIFALLAYRHVVAAVCVAPFALYFERDMAKKLRSWTVWFWLFLNALLGITLAMGSYYYGLRDTSATYSINFLNLVPITTFIFSIICRMEKVTLQTWMGKLKIVGVILCIGGSLTTSLYKGKEFHIGQSSHHNQIITTVQSSKTNMLRGTLFLVGSCLSFTAWYLVQTKLHKIFPLKYCGTMLTCIIASIQAAAIGLCLDCRKGAWGLKWDLQLVTILYSGALSTAATFCIIHWVISIKGPTYPTMFNPLALIFVAILEAILLGESITLGILLGMVLILTGLYSFLWSKKQESRCLPKTNVVALEVLPGITTKSIEVLSTTIVVPSSSPDNPVLELGNQKTDMT